ncbi:sigma-70 family RNA polymerase sigma factor [Streptomyces sp. NPDC091215]|uniref:sigma-70 family RNA polymerase sigma factor n=1 Tax=Streptomyces sp. NPDC091215 TaxID=3155192 RepID=UPI0034331691
MSPPSGWKPQAASVPRQRGVEDKAEASVPGQSVEVDGAAPVPYGPVRPEDVFIPWYNENIDRLVGRAMRVCNGPEDARALIHDVGIRLLQKLKSGDAPFGSEAFTMYAERSVSNAIKSRIRKKATEPHQVPPDENMGGYDLESFTEERMVLRRVLEELPENQRKVLVLSFYEGMKPAEIAEELGLTARSVSTYKSNGLRSMREHPALARLIEKLD